ENVADGILAAAGNQILHNNARSNGTGGSTNSAGIRVAGTYNRIEGNTFTGNVNGLRVEASFNLIIHNSSANNSRLGYDLVNANQTHGPIFGVPALITTNNP